MKTVLFFVLSVGLALVGQVEALADEQAEIQQRLIARVDAVDALKTAGLVGENNLGFLEQRGPLKPDQTKVLSAENADRKALYAILAERLGLTVKVVGQGRAEDLREKSASGVWLQSRGGDWYRK